MKHIDQLDSGVCYILYSVCLYMYIHLRKLHFNQAITTTFASCKDTYWFGCIIIF